MKLKILSIIFFAILQCQLAFAQLSLEGIIKGNYGTVEQRTNQITTIMANYLNLSSEQYAKIYTINYRYSEKVEQEIVQQNLSIWSKYNKLMSIQQLKDQELKQILSQNQFQEYQKARDAVIWKGLKAMF